MGFDLNSFFASGVEGVFKGLRDFVSLWKADPNKAMEYQHEIAKITLETDRAQMQLEQALSMAQTDINKIEAASQDKFVSRWRPAVGWICAFGLLYATVIAPLLDWLGHNIAGWKEPPTLNAEVLTTTLFAMLGIAGMRSFEKYKGVSK